MKYFCVSDVHSYYEQLMEALKNNGFDIDNNEHVLCVLGDMFDRGPSSVELFKFAKQLSNANRLIYIRGNHEDLLFDAAQQIFEGKIPSSHHFSNGTIDTIAQFCNMTKYDFMAHNSVLSSKYVENTMRPILDWINNTAVNYTEIGNYVLVHGWIPCYLGLDDFRDADYFDWDRARWENGMQMWKYPKCRVDGRTVMCGHWHCSWGWSHIKQSRPEFPQKNQKDWLKSFEPFIDDGIAAIDGCVAYTGRINVLVLEV